MWHAGAKAVKFNEFKLLNSKKERDFNDWAILVDIKYYGYHSMPEGVSLFKEIISQAVCTPAGEE